MRIRLLEFLTVALIILFFGFILSIEAAPTHSPETCRADPRDCDVVATPEPSTLGLVAIGLVAGLAFVVSRRKP